MTPTTCSSFDFTLNGERVEVRGVPANTMLADYLRARGCTGTKIGCAEGDCGACTVGVIDRDAAGQRVYRAVNSCIALLPMFAEREVVTVEGLQDGAELHPVQASMVQHYGSQCGYCTPGFIMSMVEGNQRGLKKHGEIADQLCGNLCRCTGYRAIRDAALESFACQASEKLAGRLANFKSSGWIGSSGEEPFLRPDNLAQLLAMKREFPEARLIAGATEIGVEINKLFRVFPKLISTEWVRELNEVTCSESAWYFGAGATLTKIEEALGGELPSLRKMLGVFASRQIRNRATLGGNLATASPIGDMAPVLLSLDASVVLASESGERKLLLAEFFTAYRKTAMRADEVMRAVIVPRVSGRRVESFKVSKRREMDISIVAAAFNVATDEAGIVTHARLAYGGVAATPVRALKAEAALLGKRLDDADVRAVLAVEFTPIDDVRASAEYRRGLIVSLWEKFVGGAQSEAQDAEPVFVPGEEWPTNGESRALKHDSAVGHVNGSARYVDDTAEKRKMLEVWPVCSPHAHAKILSRDAAAARAIPGVVAVLLAEDIPGHNDVGATRKDEILLADEAVFFHGHMVALVVAETLAAAQAGAKAVRVEYEALPAIVSTREAIAAESFHTDQNFIRRGEVEAALAASARRISGEFEFGGQEHFYLETQAAWAEMDGEGNVLVSSSSQHPSEIQTIVGEVLHLPKHRVTVQVPRMGGGFGGKETQGNTWAALVALAAWKTGRPARVQLDRDLDMQLTGKRHPFYSRFEVGFDENGKLAALKCDLVSNGGWSLDLSLPVTDRAMFHLDNAYYIPHLTVSGRVAKTHITSQTAFRGFGGPQGMLVIEEILDRVARTLGLAPELVRERNLYHGSGGTNTTHYGEEVGDNRIQTIWHGLLERSEFVKRRAEVASWNAQSGRIKRGLAITPVKFGISFTYTAYNQAGALVLIYRDGTVQVNHGGTEMGQGLYTKILGIAMRELGLPAERIRMMMTATDKVPNTSATAASAGADLNGAAVRNACAELRERLFGVAAKTLAERYQREVQVGDLVCENAAIFARERPEEAVEFLEVVDRAYMERASLAACGFYATPGIQWDAKTRKGRPFHYFACGAAVSEVEIDGYSGMSKVRRVDILHDVGDSLNPGIDRGQIEGGFVQGMGWLTREELKWDAQGRLLTHSASTYQIPAFSDAPADFRVTLLPMAEQPGVIHGSKAVGEPPLMLAISVREAIRDAVAAFRTESGPISLPSPATGEAIYRAIVG